MTGNPISINVFSVSIWDEENLFWMRFLFSCSVVTIMGHSQSMLLIKKKATPNNRIGVIFEIGNNQSNTVHWILSWIFDFLAAIGKCQLESLLELLCLGS